MQNVFMYSPFLCCAGFFKIEISNFIDKLKRHI